MLKEEAKQKIAELVEKYQKLTAKEIKGFNEEATKQGFIQPMFRALGWDFENTNEVSPEEHASEGRVDYAFKLNGVSQFYVEAKPFKEDVNDPKHIKQAVTYAFTKGVTWGVLTNFSGIRVFNAHKDWAFISLDCKDYFASFDKLWLLSRESMETGLLKQEAINWGILPTPIPIEKRLFTQLRQWRGELFSQLRGHNKLLTRIQIDDIIQKFFNRLLFIRNCEDRGIEEPRLLSALNQWKSNSRKKEQLRKSLYELFEYYNYYYDSDLFDKHLIDSDKVIIEEDTLENILSGLYDIPGTWLAYDFKLIDADVLGAVYEQYLGYVAIKAKEKTETQLKLGIVDDETFTITKQQSHRKEQGIYYTPEFITDYIVKETVGRFIKEHGPQEPLKIRKMKILDPACGSGSFLIRAYNELLLYHAYQRGKSVSDLTKDERTTILLDNLFGVDLDKQAVEVARLNLLIRSLSGQYHLPPLKNNIKTGNSLISGTGEDLKEYFGDNWEDKNPFNWDDEFKDIMKNGGFDVVIGNPPYVRVDSLPNNDKAFWKDKYFSSVGKYDLYYLFLELALNLTSKNGIFSFITPNRYCTNTTGDNIRKLLLECCYDIRIISVSRLGVFEGAANYPVIIIGKKGQTISKRLSFYDVKTIDQLLDLHPSYELGESEIVKLPRHIIPINVKENDLKLALKLLGENVKASNFVSVQEGLRIPQSHEIEAPIIKRIPIIKQFQFSRYSKIKPASFMSGKEESVYLNSTSDRMRNCFRKKIIFAEDALQIEATLDTTKGLCQGGVYFATLTNNKYSLDYLLAIFNSKLLTFIFKSLYSGIHMGGGYLRFRTQYLEELPIHSINFSTPEKEIYDALVSLAKKMLALNDKLYEISEFETEKKAQLKQEIKSIDEKIDNLVYDLYGLNEEERKIVEGQTGNNSSKV